MKNKPLIMKIGISLIALGILIIIIFLVNDTKRAQDEGIFYLVLEDGDTQKNSVIVYYKDDTLLKALRRKYSVEIKNYSFGAVITKIDFIIEKTGFFIAFYIDDEFANIGINEVILKNRQTYKFKLEQII